MTGELEFEVLDGTEAEGPEETEAAPETQQEEEAEPNPAPLEDAEDDAGEETEDEAGEDEEPEAPAVEITALSKERDAAALRAAQAEAALKELRGSRSLAEEAVQQLYKGNLQNLHFDQVFMAGLEEALDDATPEFKAVISKLVKEASKTVETNPLKAQRNPEPVKPEAQETKPAAPTAAEKAVVRLQKVEATNLLKEMEVRPFLHAELANAIATEAGLEGEITEELVLKVVKAYKKSNRARNDDILLPKGSQPQRRLKPPTGGAPAAAAPGKGKGKTDSADSTDPAKAPERLKARKQRLAEFTRELARAGSQRLQD